MPGASGLSPISSSIGFAASTLALPVRDLAALGIGDGDGAEGRLERLGEPDPDLRRRRVERAADAGLGPIEEGVRERQRSADAR